MQNIYLKFYEKIGIILKKRTFLNHFWSGNSIFYVLVCTGNLIVINQVNCVFVVIIIVWLQNSEISLMGEVQVALGKLVESESQYFEFIKIVYKTLHLNIRNFSSSRISCTCFVSDTADITFNNE